MAKGKKTVSTTDKSRNTVVRGRQQEQVSWWEGGGGGFLRDMSINPHSVPGTVPGTGINNKTSYHHIDI